MPALDFIDGATTPRLAAWMARRFAAECPRFYEGVWREVSDEIGAILAPTSGRPAPEKQGDFQ
jgi:hypothetical protein